MLPSHSQVLLAAPSLPCLETQVIVSSYSCPASNLLVLSSCSRPRWRRDAASGAKIKNPPGSHYHTHPCHTVGFCSLTAAEEDRSQTRARGTRISPFAPPPPLPPTSRRAAVTSPRTPGTSPIRLPLTTNLARRGQMCKVRFQIALLVQCRKAPCAFCGLISSPKSAGRTWWVSWARPPAPSPVRPAPEGAPNARYPRFFNLRYKRWRTARRACFAASPPSRPRPMVGTVVGLSTARGAGYGAQN